MAGEVDIEGGSDSVESEPLRQLDTDEKGDVVEALCQPDAVEEEGFSP